MEKAGKIFLVFLLVLFFFDKKVLATSVPVPHPVDTPNYLIGAFYMPKQDSLTREWASLRKWNSEGGRGVTRWPYLGLYSGKDTEAMNWQIKWAVEHGVSLFVFDWYTSPQFQDKVVNPTWNLSISSFLSAEYNPYMKFSLYFTGIQMIDTGLNIADIDQSKKELEKIVDYWSDNYFNKSNYLKVNNKPVVFMDYEVPSLMNLGYNNVLSWMRQRAILKGFPGIYFVGMRGAYIDDNEIGWYKGAMDNIYNSSFEAISAYGDNFKNSGYECSDYPSAFGNFSNKILAYAGSKNKQFIPPLSVFFDNSTMYSQPFKCNNPNSGIFLDTLNATKTAVANNNSGALNIGGKNLIVISSWNEWLEGSNIEPGIRLGDGGDPFSYLKAVRSVFAPGATGESERPTQSIGPNNTSSFDILLDSIDSFLFTNQNIVDKWWMQGPGSALANINDSGRSYSTNFYDNYGGKIVGSFLLWKGVNLTAGDYEKVKIKFKCRAGFNFDTDCKLHNLWLSWIHDKYIGPYYNEPLFTNYFLAKDFTAPLTIPEDNQFEINLTQNTDWIGQIQEIVFRLNFTNPPNRLDYNEITFIKKSPDNTAPNPATVSCSYNDTAKAITFNWNWNGDNTCTNCSGPVGYCQRSGVSDKGFACDITNHPPFWWQIYNATKALTEYTSYDNNPGNQKNTPANSSDIDKNSFIVSCVGREQNRLKIDVETRDALGNMVGGPSYTNVRNVSCMCGVFVCLTCPSGSLAKNLGNSNCDNKIDALDFGQWRKIKGMGAVATEDVKATVDFNCSGTDGVHIINMEDFKVWAGKALK